MICVIVVDGYVCLRMIYIAQMLLTFYSDCSHIKHIIQHILSYPSKHVSTGVHTSSLGYTHLYDGYTHLYDMYAYLDVLVYTSVTRVHISNAGTHQ